MSSRHFADLVFYVVVLGGGYGILHALALVPF